MKTLDGTVDFKVADGALEGADLWYEIRRARAVLKQQAVPERPSGPPRTPFTALTGTGTMNDGVMKNDDLNVAMQYLKVTGQGTVDLPKNSLDYRLPGEMDGMRDGTLSTSGDYERFFLKDGVRYHHLIDPDRGEPARLCRSVTIVADRATTADSSWDRI